MKQRMPDSAVFHVKQRTPNRSAPPQWRPPTDDEMRAALPVLRARVRRHAQLLDHAADMAVNGGEVQAAFRRLARAFREHADALNEDDFLDPSTRDLAQDIVSVGLVGTAIDAGYMKWPDVANQLNWIMAMNSSKGSDKE